MTEIIQVRGDGAETRIAIVRVIKSVQTLDVFRRHRDRALAGG